MKKPRQPRSPRADTSPTTIGGGVDLYTLGDVPETLVRRLNALRPGPAIIRKGDPHPLANRPPFALHRWYVPVYRQSKNKRSAVAALAKWATANGAIIRAAQRAGFSCEAHVECYVRHARFELPFDARLVETIQRKGLRLHMVYCTTSP